MRKMLVRISKEVVIEFEAAVEPWMIGDQMNADSVFAVPVNYSVLRDVGSRPARPIFKHCSKLLFTPLRFLSMGGPPRAVKKID